MGKITKEILDKFLKDYQADVKDVVTIIKEDYGIALSNKDDNVYFHDLTAKQKLEMTKAIIENSEILDQLKQSDLEAEENDVSNFDDYKRLKNEVVNERRY